MSPFVHADSGVEVLYVFLVVFVMGSVDKSNINMIKICAALDFYFDPNHFAVNVVVHLQVEINKTFQRKIVNIFLPIKFNICFGGQKNRLIETVLLSTHNICFG